MRSLSQAVIPVVALALLAGCGSKNELASAMVGSYLRQDSIVPGLRTHLHITPTGMAVTSPAVGGSSSIEVGGEEIAKVKLQMGTAGSALFESVRCDGDASCRFQTKDGCEGTITRDDRGDVVVVVTGDCSPWSGKWLSEKAGDPCPKATCPQAPAPSAPTPGSTVPPSPPPSSPPHPSPPPTALPSPSDTAAPGPSAAAPPSPNCLMDCNQGSMTCLRECKIDDLSCLKRCNDQGLECAKRCR